MGTGSSAPRAPAEPVPSLWDAPGCVPPTQDGRKTRGSALSCKARRIPLALFAGCWPRAIAPRWLGGGGRGGDRPSPGCWHSREPGSALLPLAEHADLSLSQHFAPAGCSKGLGGAAADGQPDLFLPPRSSPSPPLPSTHPAPMNIYLYLPVCSESLDTIRTLKSARGGCPVRGAPVAPGRQMRVKGRA